MHSLKPALRPCPGCACSRVNVLHRQQFEQARGSPLPAAYDVVACPNCGFVYADTPASQDVYDHYYASFSKYEDAAIASGSGADAHDARRLDELAAAVAGRAGRDARILDVGCANGGLLEALKRRGCSSLHGVDAASGCVDTVRAQGHVGYCLPISRLAELTVAGPFDVIVVSHVIEHVVDLSAIMRALAALLAADGLLYLETPDAARYGDHAYVPFYFFDSEHINHFDSRQLVILGSGFGFGEESSGARTLEVAPNRFYPATWAWLHCLPSATAVRPSPDQRLAAAVSRYIAGCRAAPEHDSLRRLAEEGTAIVVWGAGSLAQRLFGQGALARCKVVAIVDRDRNKQGQFFAGFRVEAPETALRKHPGVTVLVLAAVHADAIAAQAMAIQPGARIEILDAVPAGARLPMNRS